MTQKELKASLERLISAGWTQDRIAAAAKVNQSTISRIMAGSGCRVPTYLRLIAFISEQEQAAA